MERNQINQADDEELFREEFHRMISRTEPDKIQKQRIYTKTVGNNKNTNVHKYKVYKAAAIVFLFAFIAVGAVGMKFMKNGGVLQESAYTEGVTTSTGSSFSKMLRNFFGMDEKQEEIAVQTLDLPNEVYASELEICNKDTIVFANERAMLVYDRAMGNFVGIVDLQEIECNFFNADTIETHIFMKEGKIYIFNERMESKWGNDGGKWDERMFRRVYTYDLASADSGENVVLTVSEDEAFRNECGKDWEAYRNHNVFDTFDAMQSEELDLNEMFGTGECTYSKNCIKWTDEEENPCVSCLVVMEHDNKYLLYTKVGNEKELAVEVLFEGNSEGADDETGKEDEKILPQFIYSGDNEVLRAICREVLKEGGDSRLYLEPGGVIIPVPVIRETVQDGDCLVVFCILQSYGYYRNSNTLICCSGISGPVRFKLKSSENETYEVIESKFARDGADYAEDVKEFCGEYGLSWEKVYPYNHEESEKIREAAENLRKSLIKMYAEDNNLDIKYYKDFGDDPVDIRR